MAVELKKLVIETLKCPSCLGTMRPPINLCYRGHSMCNFCFPKVRSCPVCRGPKNNGARNYSLEDIYEIFVVPCKFKNLGCPETILEDEDGAVEQHQKVCKYAIVHCPFEEYNTCDWMDSRIRLKDHLEEKHANNFHQKDKTNLVSQNFGNRMSYDIFDVIYVFDNYFRLTWDIDENTGMTRWTVYILGPPELAKKFYYELEFTNRETQLNKIPLSYKALCESQPQNREDFFGDHSCFCIHRSELDELCTTNKNLDYKITIHALEDDCPQNLDRLFGNN